MSDGLRTPAPGVAPAGAAIDPRPARSTWTPSGEVREAGEAYMAERAALGALKPVEHAGERSGWLLPEANGAPIGVELVRGADGPGDDEWHVVVGGLRCRSGGAPGSEERLCYLPPPCNPTAPLGVDTRVRPVMVSVRLENPGAAARSGRAYDRAGGRVRRGAIGLGRNPRRRGAQDVPAAHVQRG